MNDNEKVEKIQGLLEEAQILLAEIRPNNEIAGRRIPDWMNSRLTLWAKVYNENNGAPISKEKVDELWKAMGKKRQGSAGFFTGKKASLQWMIDGKVSLSKSAEKQTLYWTGVSLKEYAKSQKK